METPITQENLNIEFHHKRLILKALTKFVINKRAAKELGISVRTLYRLKRNYGIQYIDDTWIIEDKGFIKFRVLKERKFKK